MISLNKNGFQSYRRTKERNCSSGYWHPASTRMRKLKLCYDRCRCPAKTYGKHRQPSTNPMSPSLIGWPLLGSPLRPTTDRSRSYVSERFLREIAYHSKATQESAMTRTPGPLRGLASCLSATSGSIQRAIHSTFATLRLDWVRSRTEVLVFCQTRHRAVQHNSEYLSWEGAFRQ